MLNQTLETEQESEVKGKLPFGVLLPLGPWSDSASACKRYNHEILITCYSFGAN